MFKYYVLNIKGVECWQKQTTSDGEIYTKQKIDENINLYFEKFGNPLSESFYMDCITNRVIGIEKNNNTIELKPSNIVMDSDRLQKRNIFLIKNEMKNLSENKKLLTKYRKISEEILYYSWFCEIIFKEQNISEIDANLVNQKINEMIPKSLAYTGKKRKIKRRENYYKKY